MAKQQNPETEAPQTEAPELATYRALCKRDGHRCFWLRANGKPVFFAPKVAELERAGEALTKHDV